MGAIVACVGALMGALGIFWTIVTPLLAIALVVLLVVLARRISTRPAPA